MTPPLSAPDESELLARAKLCQCGICEACEFAEKRNRPSNDRLTALEAAGNIGADLSPGDPLCAWAAEEIRSLRAEIKERQFFDNLPKASPELIAEARRQGKLPPETNGDGRPRNSEGALLCQNAKQPPVAPVAGCHCYACDETRSASRRHEMEIPRRSRIDKFIPAETAIRNALMEVEALGAHPLLTEIVTMLSDAQRKVADWHDGGRPGGLPEKTIAEPGT